MKFTKDYLSKVVPEDAIFWCVALTFLLFPTGTAPPLIGLGLACAVWLFSGRFVSALSIVQQAWFRPVVLFILLPWIGLTYSQNLDLGMDYAMKTKYWIALFVSASCCIDEKRIFILVSALWAGLLAGAALALIQFVGLVTAIDKNFLGFGIVHTLVSMYLIVGILMAAFYIKNINNFKIKLLLSLLILAFVFHLTVLEGRSGYLIFILISPLVAWDLMARFPLKIKALACLIIMICISLSPVVRVRVNDTYTKLMSQKDRILEGEDVKDFPRFYMAREALNIIKQHPVIGIGTGSLAEATRTKGHEVSHPHNNLLYMGASFGIVGVISCLWLFWNMFIRSWRCRKTPLGYFVFSTCLVLFLGGLFDTQILNTGTLLMLSMTYGFLHHLDGGKEGSV